MASCRRYDNSDVIVTLIKTNFIFIQDSCGVRRTLCSNLGGIDPENPIEPP